MNRPEASERRQEMKWIKKTYWKLHRKYWRWKIKKIIGEIPKPEGKPIEWRRLRSLDEIKTIIADERQDGAEE